MTVAYGKNVVIHPEEIPGISAGGIIVPKKSKTNKGMVLSKGEDVKQIQVGDTCEYLVAPVSIIPGEPFGIKEAVIINEEEILFTY